MRRLQWNKNGQIWKRYWLALQLTKVRNKKEVIDEARTSGVVDGYFSSQEFGVGASIPKVQRQSRAQAHPNSRRRSKRFSWRVRRVYPPPHDSHPDAGEARNGFWSMSGNFRYRHHVEPRVKLHSPREESFPFPVKHIQYCETQDKRRLYC